MRALASQMEENDLPFRRKRSVLSLPNQEFYTKKTVEIASNEEEKVRLHLPI